MHKDEKLKSVSFFCPAYNEEGNLERVINSVLPVLKEVSDDFEIIIIDNASKDNTRKIADKLASKFPQIRVIHHEHNREYGGALKSGFQNAGKEFVVYTDSDNQYDFANFKDMVPLILKYDIVSGYRVQRHDRKYRVFQSKIFNWVINLLFGLGVKDINCSFKVYRRKVLDDIEITSSSAFIDAEMLIKARHKGYSIFDVPVEHFPRLAGQSTGAKPHVVFLTLKEIISYWVKFRIINKLNKLGGNK